MRVWPWWAVWFGGWWAVNNGCMLPREWRMFLCVYARLCGHVNIFPDAGTRRSGMNGGWAGWMGGAESGSVDHRVSLESLFSPQRTDTSSNYNISLDFQAYRNDTTCTQAVCPARAHCPHPSICARNYGRSNSSSRRFKFDLSSKRHASHIIPLTSLQGVVGYSSG